MKKILAVFVLGLSFLGANLVWADGMEEALAKYGQEKMIAAFEQMSQNPQQVNQEQGEIILFSIDESVAKSMIGEIIKPFGADITPAQAKPIFLAGLDEFPNADIMRPIFEKIFTLAGY